jgi:hypothetical protein
VEGEGKMESQILTDPMVDINNIVLEASLGNKYKIISPRQFVEPIENEKYKDLIKYLEERYW